MEALLIIPALVILLIAWKWNAIRRWIWVMRNGVPEVSNSVDLVPVASMDWHHPRTVQRYRERLLAEGFEHLDDYDVLPAQTIQLGAYVREDGAMGIITDLAMADAALEFVLEYEDTTSLTVSNSSIGGGLDSMPGAQKAFHKGLEFDALLARFGALRSDKPALVLDAGSFPGHVKTAYEREMKWRNDRGGTTEAEIRRQMEYMGETVSDEQIREVHDLQREQHDAVLRSECLARVLDERGLTIAQYEDVRDRLVVVLANDSGLDITEQIEDAFPLSPEQLARLQSLSEQPGQGRNQIRNVFDEWFPGGRRLGASEKPAEADVYLMPRHGEQ